MKTLVSMTDFVISQIKTESTVNDSFKKYLADIRNYALFLKQPLTLGMFVPCDEKENVLEEPKGFNEWHKWGISSKLEHSEIIDCQKYWKAKEKVLFKGFEVNTLLDDTTKRLTSPNGRFNIAWYNSEKGWYLSNGIEGMIVEELLNLDLELTESAIKQIFG